MSYHDREEVSNSDLDYAAKSYADYLNYKKNGGKTTPAMKFGTIFHEFILEDKSNFVVDGAICEDIGGKVPRNTKKYKEWKAEQVEEIVTADDYDMLSNMQHAAYSHEEAKKILSIPDAEIEKEIYFDFNGFKCRSKLDFVSKKEKLIVDLKSIKEITAEEITKAIIYGYARQGAFYSLAVQNEYKEDFKFKLIFVEKKAPYKVAVVPLNEVFKIRGTIEITNILNKMKLEREMENGYYQGEWDIQPPAWLVQQVQQMTQVMKQEQKQIEEDI